MMMMRPMETVIQGLEQWTLHNDNLTYQLVTPRHMTVISAGLNAPTYQLLITEVHK